VISLVLFFLGMNGDSNSVGIGDGTLLAFAQQAEAGQLALTLPQPCRSFEQDLDELGDTHVSALVPVSGSSPRLALQRQALMSYHQNGRVHR
jgi:hypothetical protein